MNRVLSLLLLPALVTVAAGSPPLTGGFMTGSDSAVYVYWFHPGTQVWEMGFEEDAGTYDVFPSSTPGLYSIAQRAALPRWSLVAMFSERLYLGDHHPNWPGTQFSPFGFSVYAEGSDSLPKGAPLAAGRDSLLPTNTAGDGWVDHAVAVPNLTGEAFWFSHDWDPQTPSAPELKAVQSPDAARFNQLGTGSGETRVWHGIGYAAVFRYRFLTLIPPDSEATAGLRSVNSDSLPAGFTVTRYSSSEGDAVQEWCRTSDTLLWRLPVDPGDSIGIRTGCGDDVEGEGLTLTYDLHRVMPITVAVDCDNCDTVSSFCICYLHVTSNAPDTLQLSLGLDRARMEAPFGQFVLPPMGSVTIPIAITKSDQESRQEMIVIEDGSRYRYPYLVIVDYVWTGPSAVDDPGGKSELGMPFSVLPNPIPPGTSARFRTNVSSGRVDIYNLLGQRVAEISIKPGQDTGWNGRDMDGRAMPSGVYFARVAGDRDRSAVRKFVLLR
jgi:hypothetical protein